MFGGSRLLSGSCSSPLITGTLRGDSYRVAPGIPELAYLSERRALHFRALTISSAPEAAMADRIGLGAYGERIFGSGKYYVQSNMSKYFSGHDVQYYFQVNDQYVKNKLKVVLFPFLHRGHWTRIAEQVAGGLRYRPPHYDINAPDLYIPLMAFGTYLVLSGILMGLSDRFSPEALGEAFTKALIVWVAQGALVRFFLFTLGGAEAPLLDLAAYGGYIFVGASLCILGAILWRLSYYVIWLWTSFCMAMFLVKTVKRILFAEARSYDRDSSRHHYLLLCMAVAQFPISFWLGCV